ncbi:Calx-beta domain-containing protein [Roseivirga pacifica]|uniref:Calx-beta domain-containing protein n=1 Tax=Roseivirga pacifica TaxID=1267423 RepID=UPI002094DC9C|nr:Calx-beta domain-containing protein [Roseivirga pacifica]
MMAKSFSLAVNGSGRCLSKLSNLSIGAIGFVDSYLKILFTGHRSTARLIGLLTFVLVVQTLPFLQVNAQTIGSTITFEAGSARLLTGASTNPSATNIDGHSLGVSAVTSGNIVNITVNNTVSGISGGSDLAVIMTATGTNVTSFSYKSDNAANNFSLTSFAFAVATGTTQNITVQGYDNGSAVSGAITKTISSAGTTNFTVTSGDISASSGWGNIDEIRMTMNTPAPANFAIDDVLLAAAVASNNAPTASAFTANPSENLTYTFSTNDFGYNDSDSDPLDHVLIESVPANGTLYLDADNDDVFDGGEAVSVSQQISKADLDAGNLQYIQNGSTGSSFQFEVNDGTDNSTGNYIATLTMLPVPTVTLSLVTSSKSESLTTANGITATLSNSYGANTVVNLAFSGSATGSGVDYSVSSTSITIGAGNTTNTIVLTNVPDALYEGNEEVDIDISTVTNGTENGTQQQTFTIIDDDSQPNATLEVLSIYNPLTDESGGQAYVRGKIDAVAGTTITIPLSFSGTASGGGTDYSITGSSIELSPGETMDSIRITSQYDGIEEGSETVIVDMGSPTNAIESGTQQVTITIIDEDATPPRINSIVRQSPSSSPTNADLLVWDVTFNEAVSNVGAADFTVSGTTGTISSVTNPSGNTYRVTVSGGDLASLNGTVTLGFAGGQDIVDSFGTALSNTTPTGTNDNTFVVDNSAPAAPSTPDMTTATDSGNEEHTAGSTSDNLTKNTTPTFEGTAESGATVKIISNIDGEVGSGTATGGSYSITTSALTAGAHTITATATDASANTSSASSALSITIDTTSPTVSISTTSSNPTNDNPIPVTITFNSEADNMKENDITVVNGTTGDFASPDSTSFTVSITPSGNGIVQVSVAAGSAFDRAGNANTVSNTLSLTYDGTAPAFSSVSPSSSSAVNTANVGYTLSEAIASGTVTFTRTSGTTDGSSPHVVTLTGSELNAGARASAALTNAPTLVSGTIYTISFDGQDAAGNSATTVNITNVTFDNTAPIFDGVNSTPADGATDVGAADNLVLDFSENIAAGTGNITIRDVTGSTNFEVFDIATATATSNPVNGALGILNDKLYINPTNSFTETNAYSVRIDANAIDDASGNSFAGITNDTDYNFSVADVTAPTIQSSSPADGASNVTLSQNLTITFDDNMAVGTGNITIVETGVGNFDQLDVTNGTLVSVSGATVTLNPAGTLKKGTNYHIEIDASALDDDAGNDFAGISDATTLNFKTVDVVINEVVTDPQQDWSTNGFDGTFPGSPTVTAGTDEWVELYIKSAGIDFTGWTIELTDGTDFSGDLTNTGAFDVSNYVSSGSGTFNGSESGDYLILGDPDGGSAMNNDVLIVLKDPGGAIVDQVQLGGGVGEAPSGDATSRSDESVQRIPNGTDTDADDADFVQAAASIGAVNDASGPQITSLGLHNSNAFIEIFANEGLYSTNGGSGALEISDIDISISGGTAHTPVVTSLKQLNGTSDLVGGENMIRVNFTTTGVADGGETITINFADGSSVFDAAGNAAAATQSNNTRILNDLVDPYITGVSLASDNSYIDVTFNEGVYEDNCGGGGLTAADFDLQISNGTATVPVISSVKQNDSATEGSASALAGGETTIRIFFSVTGTPDGGETLEVDLQANEVFDINGRTGVADQTTNNTATLNDEASPTVLEVTSDASNGSFKVDDEINIYVQYSEEVFVTGTPQLELETGTTDRTIDYVDRSVSTLRFVYTVQAGDSNADLDVTSSSAFTLNGGTIQDAAGNNAVLTVPQNATGGSLKQNKDLVIDGVVPSITSLGLHNGNAFIEIFASEGLYSTNGGSGALEISDIDISISGGTAHTPVVTSLKQLNGTSDLVGGENMIRVNFTTTGVADGGETITINFADGSSVFDAAGNAAVATQSNNTRTLNDLVDPYITGVSLASDNSYIDVTFNEGVYEDNCGGGGLTAADFDLQISNGTATLPVISSVKQNDNTAEASATALSGGETTIRIFFSVTGTPDGGETLEVDLQANEVFDINGRTGVADQTTNNTVTLNDEAAPTVTSIARQSPTTTPTNADQLVWDVTFDEVVANVGTADFSVSGTTGTVTSVTNPSGNLYRVTASGGDLASLNATVTLSFVGAQDIADAAGNALVNTTPTGTNDNTFVVDNTAPRVTSIARQSPTTTPTNADQLVWDVTFDEAVANVGTADFSVSGTTGTVTSVTNPSGNIYRVTVSGGDLASLNGTVTLSFSGGQDISDVAGNTLTNVTPTGTNNNSFVVDNTAATITSITAPADGSYNSGKNLTFTVAFSEAVNYDDGSSCEPPYLVIDVGGSNKNATYASGNGTNTWTFTYSVGVTDSDSDGIVISSFDVGDVGVEDEAGNALNTTLPTLPNTSAILVDNAAPTISTLSPADNATGVSLNGDFTLTFNEDVAANTGNVTVHRVSDDGVVRTFDVTNNTVVSISGNVVTFDNTSDLALITEHYILVDNGAFEDVAGNAFGGIISTSAWSFTTTDQTEISINDPSVAEGESGSTSLTFTVSLSQPAPAGGATVAYATSDGTASSASDYTAASGTVSFAVGESSKTITVSVAGDAIVEDDETITVTLTSPTGTNMVIGDGTGTGTITNDDQATVTIADVTVDEEDGTATVSLVLDKAVDGGLTVDLSTADGTATTADSDYTALVSSPVTFTGTVGESKNVNITIGSDSKLEANETFTVAMSNLTPATVASGDIDVTDGATVTINNDDTATVTIADESGNEDDGAITLTATLDNPVQGGFTVEVITVDGTATVANSDYTALVGQSLTFAGTAGETETFTVTPGLDAIVEANETFKVSMTNLSATTLAVGISDEATVTITNDDAATFAIDDVTKNENADGGATTTYTFTATLTGSIDQAISVDYATSNGTAGASDYTAATGALNFTGTDGETQTFNVTVANDDIVELDETFTVTLSNVQAGGKNVTISDATGLGTITNDDAASISIDDVSKAENADGGATTDFVFTVTLNKAVDTGVSLSYATNDATATTAGGDYTSASGQLNFAGTAGETEEITVTVANDGLAEFDEGFGVTLSSLQASGRNVTISDNVGLGTIENDDTAGFTITETAGSTETTEAGGTDSFDVVLDAEPLSDVVISITSGDTGEGTVSASTLTFTTANWNTAQTVTVTGVDDDIIDGTQSFNITLAIEDATSDDVYDPVADQTVSVDNTDDDIAGFTISKTTATVSETGTTDQFTVVLDAEPGSDVVINVSSNDTGEATVGSAALTFTSINWDTPQTVVITGTDDAIEDGHVMSTITLSVDVAASDSDFGSLADQTVTVTTNDDDDLTAPSGYSVTLNDVLVGNAEVSTSTFTFAGAEIGTTYNYTVSSNNGGTNVTGSGTIATATDQVTLADLSGLNDGTLTLSVTLTDASSNVGTAATDDTVLDTTAPVAPIVTSISDDTGSSASDGITSDNTPSVNGTAEANATIEIFVDGNSVGTTTADASGDWTLAYTGVTPLTDGTIAVTANATDAAGNTGATSTAVNVTIDTTAPAAATFNGITNDTGASSSDGIINDMSSVTISGTAEANATFDLTFNGVTYSGLSVDGSGNWSMDISNALTEDATETVSITITDAAGNTSAAATYDITLDITAPEAPTVDLDATSDKGTSDSDDLTNYTIRDAMTFSGTAEASASVEVELTYNGTTFTGLPATTDGSGNWSIDVGSTIGGVLVDGTVNDLTLRAIATDVAGNVGTAGELTIVLDQALDATLTPADNATDVLPNANLVMNFSEDVYKGTGNITIKQSSDNTVLETIDITSANVVVSGAEVTIDPTSLLLPPSEEFYVTVDAGTFTDDAGNSYVGISNNTAWTFTIIAAPVVTSVSVPTADTYGIGDELEFTVNFTLPVNTSGSLSLPITLGASAKEATVAADASNSNSLTFSYTIAEGDLDTDGITVGSTIDLNGATIVDEFGTDAILTLNNTASTANVNVDGIRAIPTIASVVSDLTNAAFTVTVTYDEPVSGLTADDLDITNGTADNVTVVTAGLVWTADITPTADGAVSVTLPAGTVNDQAGNTSAASANTISTTFDGTAPTVSSITRAEADQLNTADTDANFTVTFSEDVTGVDVTDFETVVTGTATASINSVTVVDAKTYTVNVNGISGEGTIGLNLKANSSILDAATNALTADFTGDVYTTNYLPTAIGLSSSSIDENSAVGSVVGTIASTDQDATDSHTYTLVAGTGDADNASFSMNGDQLLTAEVFDFETKDSYSIRVKTDDGFGGTFEQALTITVDNVLEYSVFVTGEGAFEETILGFSTTKTWTATNNGELPVEVRVASTPTGFSVVPGSFILGVGESKEISAVFTPESAREYSGNVVFDYEGGVEVEAVSGEGVIVTDVDDQLIDEAAISVYPNPASDVITLDLTELYGLPVDVNIYNATGKPMFTKKDITDSKVEVRVTSYESGIYIVRFSNDKSVVNKKVMIKR